MSLKKLLMVSTESILTLAGISKTEFEDILNWLDIIKIYQKECELYQKAIEENVDDFVKNIWPT